MGNSSPRIVRPGAGAKFCVSEVDRGLVSPGDFYRQNGSLLLHRSVHLAILPVLPHQTASICLL